MKIIYTFWLLLASQVLSATPAGFVEDNNLSTFDSLMLPSNIDEAQFQGLIQIAQNSYDTYIREGKLKALRIQGFWPDSTVNAYMNPQLQINIVTIYGGLARRPELSLDGLGLVLCHEIGHAYGGQPDKRAPLFKVSVEGQADYFGAMNCLARIIDHIPRNFEAATPPSIQKLCAQGSGDSDRCERLLIAGQSVGELLAMIKAQPVPSYDTPDQTVVPSTLASYPKLIQCRLDTYLRGFLGQARPRCWYKS